MGQLHQPGPEFANCDLYNKGLASDDCFIVCTDIFKTRTTEYANLILPTAFHFEKTGVYGCTERRSQLTRKAAKAPTEEFALTGGTVKKFVKGMDPMAETESKNDLPYQFYGPAHEDRKLWIWLRPQADPSEIPDADYPFYLPTGRIIDHWHTISMTGRIPELLRANLYAYVEINPKDAEKLGIKPGDMIEIRSRRGINVLPAKVYEGPIEGMVFACWHDQEQSRMINKVTKDDYDPASKEPEFKICVVQVKRLSGPQPLKPFLV